MLEFGYNRVWFNWLVLSN